MTISDTMKQAIFGQDTSEVFLVLLTIDHADLATPIRVVNNTESITSNGNTFLPFPFNVTLPLDAQQSQPRARLEIDNIDRQIVEAIRTITSSPSVMIEVIRASDPDTIEATWTDFVLQDVSYNKLTVEGTLAVENFTLEPYPADQFVPSSFPGIF